MLKLLNLIKYNDIIKPGQRFVKVGNTYMPVGIGGSIAQVSGESEGSSDGYVVVELDGVLKAQKLAFDGTEASNDGSPEAIGSVGLFNTGMEEPAYKGSGGGGSFYKCASVDGTTWSGNKAFQNEDGTWDFESTVTSDLEFGLGYTPEVGKVYNADATIEVGKYNKAWDSRIDDMVFSYVSNIENATPSTGQSVSYQENVTFVQDSEGVTVADFTNGFMETTQNADWFPSGNSEVTARAKFRCTAQTGYAYLYGLWNNQDNTGFSLFVNWNGSDGYFTTAGTGSLEIHFSITDKINDGEVHTMYVTYDRNTFIIYLDGEEIARQDANISFETNTPFFVGKGYPSNITRFNGYIYDVKVWDVCFTGEEVVKDSQT